MIEELILLVVLSFLPPLLYMIWIRNTEKCHREKWKGIFLCFFWGASISILASLFLEIILDIPLMITIRDENHLYLITVVVLAPIVEELTKPLALRMRSVKSQIDELEDGLIYGAVAGLGFSATENLFYGWSFLTSEVLFMFIIFMIVRSFGGCLLHASATALTGYGYGKVLLKKTSILRILPYYLLAIIAHGLYNFLVSYDLFGLISGLLIAFLFVAIAISMIRKKIRQLDSQSC